MITIGHSSTAGTFLVFTHEFTVIRFKGTKSMCLNVGSYDYLGFTQTTGPCADAAIEAIYDYGVGSNSARRDYGNV